MLYKFKQLFILAIVFFFSLSLTCANVLANSTENHTNNTVAADNVALQKRLKAIVAKYPGVNPGISVLHIPSGKLIEINGSQPKPLASVFKIPVMLELARQLQNGILKIDLDDNLTIKSSDKCIGSGELQHKSGGSQVKLSRALELMETVSDNTATDMIFKLIGTKSVNRLMSNLGLTNSDIYLTNRSAWLISLGQGSIFKGMSPEQIASTWKNLNSNQRHQNAYLIEKENLGLTIQKFQALEDASFRRCTAKQNMLVAATVDNMGSPNDFTKLLSMLWKNQILEEDWSDYCLDILLRQKYNSRIPKLLPKGTKVYHKTGTLSGIVNDAGIVMATNKDPLAIAVFVTGVDDNEIIYAQDLIARISRACWEAYRP